MNEIIRFLTFIGEVVFFYVLCDMVIISDILFDSVADLTDFVWLHIFHRVYHLRGVLFVIFQ